MNNPNTLVEDTYFDASSYRDDIWARYEDAYGGYLKFFKDISALPEKNWVLINVPVAWVPLCNWLGFPLVHIADKPMPGDESCIRAAVLEYSEYSSTRKVGAAESSVITVRRFRKMPRLTVEVLCGFRPETVDALWKVDSQWETERISRLAVEYQKEFFVTNNGSFHRAEVMRYIDRLPTIIPPSSQVCLVPCAADKPYPSPMHKAVRELLPVDFYMANATGVLGIVPESTWDFMPHYDSGIPNEWRLQNIAMHYFNAHHHDEVVVYADYYSLALRNAFLLLGYDEIQTHDFAPYGITLLAGKNAAGQRSRVWFVNPIQFYADYIDLMDATRLNTLKLLLNHLQQF